MLEVDGPRRPRTGECDYGSGLSAFYVLVRCHTNPARCPDPIGADIPWLLTTPASAGITGTIFYHFPTDVTHAVIYPNKQTPDNGNTKILWKVGSRCWLLDWTRQR